MKKRAIILLAVLQLCLLCGCNNEDDVEGILTGHDWKLSYLVYNSLRTSAGSKIYTLSFTNSSFTLTTPSSSTITGNWKADGESRTFKCSNVKISSGSLSGDSIARKAKIIMENAASYEGDSNTILIKDAGGSNFVQFYSKQL